MKIMERIGPPKDNRVGIQDILEGQVFTYPQNMTPYLRTKDGAVALVGGDHFTYPGHFSRAPTYRVWPSAVVVLEGIPTNLKASIP